MRFLFHVALDRRIFTATISKVALDRRIFTAAMSSVTLGRRIPAATIKSFKEKIADLCNENSFSCVDNTNTLISVLLNDGLHLLETGNVC